MKEAKAKELGMGTPPSRNFQHLSMGTIRKAHHLFELEEMQDTEKREREDCDEIGNMTRSDGCFKLDNLKTDRDKEKKKGKEKTDAFLKEIQR
ncbi:unnamed protein product [Ilex paraguariensis]|uniref:Uncharacterized protein n=1 Tax=Ilex paraguariensis TaxID=185542 RepID=A0ABC8TGB1_9AQUA